MEMGTDIFISAKTKVNLANDFVLASPLVTSIKGKRAPVEDLKSLKSEQGQGDKLKKIILCRLEHLNKRDQ